MIAGFNMSDIAVCLIVLLFIGWGFKKGFVKSVLGLGSIIISIVLALVLYQPVSAFLQTSVIGEYVTVNIAKTLESSENEYDEQKSEETAEALKLPSELTKNVMEGINTAKNSAIGSLSVGISSLAINLISMLVVFFVVKLIMKILTMLLETITKIPVISTLNKALGGVLGAVSGVITVYLLLAVLTFATAVYTDNKIVNNVLEADIASKMYNENFIVGFISADK